MTLTSSSPHLVTDGLEYERSGILLDLRYIPDEVEFSQKPRDTATEMALNYKQPIFSNKAKSSSKVELTWDRDDPERFKMRKKAFTKDDINEIDLQAYLDSESEEEEDDVDEKQRVKEGRNKLRALLGEEAPDDDADDDDEDGSDEESESENEEMVITFDGGLGNIGKEILEKKKQRDEQKDETTWEAYLRKRNDKKKAKKDQRKKIVEFNVSQSIHPSIHPPIHPPIRPSIHGSKVFVLVLTVFADLI